MTEEQKDRLRQAKIEATATLAAIPIERYRLSEVDSRLDAYVREVAANPERHNLYEQLAVVLFFRKCDRYGINATEVWRFYNLYESLYFPGKQGQQRYKLTPVQCFQFANIYAFWNGGRRVVREVVLYVPRKFSKTTSTASLAIDDLLYGDANAESYTGANSADQAKKCFDVIRGCMRRLDPNERRYTINEQTIKSRRKDRSAFAQCLTANARTSLKKVCELSPEHISAYGLKIEEGTVFAKIRGSLRLPDEDEEYEMYCMCEDILRDFGYERYEISNFSKRGYESKHNIHYWELDDYIGFGVAAHSCFGGERFGNSRNISGFLKGQDITEERRTISVEESRNEYVMLGLRLQKGICVRKYKEKFGRDFKADFPQTDFYVSKGFLNEKDGCISFSTKGFFVSNTILSQMLNFDE